MPHERSTTASARAFESSVLAEVLEERGHVHPVVDGRRGSGPGGPPPGLDPRARSRATPEPRSGDPPVQGARRPCRPILIPPHRVETTRTSRIVTSVAVAVATASVLAGARSRIDAPPRPHATVVTTTAPMPSPTTVRATTARRRAEASPASRGRRKSSRIVERTSTPGRTVTTRPVAVGAEREQALQACLALAAANHSLVVAANETWFQQQLRGLSGRRVAATQYKALQIEEAQAQTEIAAQYSIDQSNCYLEH